MKSVSIKETIVIAGAIATIIGTIYGITDSSSKDKLSASQNRTISDIESTTTGQTTSQSDNNNDSTSAPNTPIKTKSDYMSDFLEPYFKEVRKFEMNTLFTMGGTEYNKNYYIETWNFEDGKISFNLGGKYNELKGTIGLVDGKNKYDGIIEIYGDDNQLKKYVLKAGDLPYDITINVTDVKNLSFIFKYPRYGGYDSTYGMANIILK